MLFTLIAQHITLGLRLWLWQNNRACQSRGVVACPGAGTGRPGAGRGRRWRRSGAAGRRAGRPLPLPWPDHLCLATQARISATYSGDHSLRAKREKSYSFTATLDLGAHLRKGAGSTSTRKSPKGCRCPACMAWVADKLRAQDELIAPLPAQRDTPALLP